MPVVITESGTIYIYFFITEPISKFILGFAHLDEVSKQFEFENTLV